MTQLTNESIDLIADIRAATHLTSAAEHALRAALVKVERAAKLEALDEATWLLRHRAPWYMNDPVKAHKCWTSVLDKVYRDTFAEGESNA